MQASVDRSVCIGCGLCVVTCLEVFSMAEAGCPVSVICVDG